MPRPIQNAPATAPRLFPARWVSAREMDSTPSTTNSAAVVRGRRGYTSPATARITIQSSPDHIGAIILTP